MQLRHPSAHRNVRQVCGRTVTLPKPVAPRRVLCSAIAPERDAGVCAHRPTVAIAFACPGGTAESWTTAIRSAEESGDWLAAFEVLTEATVTKATLPNEAMEGVIRVMAQGGQWQRSADLLDRLMTTHTPETATILSVFTALAKGQQLERTQAILQTLKVRGAGVEVLTPAHNTVVKLLARSGMVMEAYNLLDGMVSAKHGEQMRVDNETFACVCAELLKAGDGDKAEEVLEWRDFLMGD